MCIQKEIRYVDKIFVMGISSKANIMGDNFTVNLGEICCKDGMWRRYVVRMECGLKWSRIVSHDGTEIFGSATTTASFAYTHRSPSVWR
jgi:hypothetical protein